MLLLSLLSLILSCTACPLLSPHCFSLVDLVRVDVCCWCMTFQLCVQSNWQRGSKEGWGVMRGAGVVWGLPTNRYHGEPLLSKPPRAQLLTCSVMGLLNSILYMDTTIYLLLSLLLCSTLSFLIYFFSHFLHVLSVLLPAFSLSHHPNLSLFSAFISLHL